MPRLMPRLQISINYSDGELRNVELVVLDALEWKLHCSTGVDFVHHWLPRLSSDVGAIIEKQVCDCLKGA